MAGLCLGLGAGPGCVLQGQGPERTRLGKLRHPWVVQGWGIPVIPERIRLGGEASVCWGAGLCLELGAGTRGDVVLQVAASLGGRS